MAHYFLALSIGILGSTTFALRLPMALLSLLAVPLMYQWLRTLFANLDHPGTEPRIGSRNSLSVLGAANLAFSFWHLTMSRSGYRVSLVITFAILTAYLFWRGWRTQKLRYLIGAGIALGLSQYTYLSARFLPLVYGFFWLLRLAKHRNVRTWLAWRSWRGLLLMASASLVVFMPLGIFFLEHPDAFSERAGQVWILNRIATGDITWSAHLRNVIGAFWGGSDKNWRHGLVGRSGFETLNLLGFWIGLPIVLRKIRKPRYQFLLLNLLITWLPLWLTADQSVQAWRLAIMFPPYYTLATIGILAAGKKLATATDTHKRWAIGIAGLAVACNGLQTSYRYFGRWADHPQVYEAFEGPHVDFVRYLIERAKTEDLLVPFYLYEYPTTRFLLYDAFQEVADPTHLEIPADASLVRLAETYHLKNMEVTKTSPYVWLTQAPSANGGCAYILSEEQTTQLETLKQPGPSTTYPHPLTQAPMAEITPVEGLGPVLQAIFQDYQAIKPISYTIEDHYHLSGYRVVPKVTPPANTLKLNLYWQSHRQQPKTHKLFIHLIDPEGNTMRIMDMPVFPGDLSRWRAHRFLKTYEIPIPQDIPKGTYLLRMGLFDPQTQVALKVRDLSDRAPPASQQAIVLSPFYVETEGADPRSPQHPMHIELGEKVVFLGYETRLAPNSQRTTDGPIQLKVKTVWSTLSPMAVDYTIFVHLLNEDNELLTNSDTQPLNGRYPTSQWKVGEIIVDTFTLSLEPEIYAANHRCETCRIAMGMYNLETMQRLPALSQGKRLMDDIIILSKLALSSQRD
jgi:hypothetical protein